MNHNHPTRDIKRYGACPACDEYHMTSCTCGRIAVGGTITESRNLDPDCVVHGVNSYWYNTMEQKAKREESTMRTRNLQGRAHKRRAGYWPAWWTLNDQTYEDKREPE